MTDLAPPHHVCVCLSRRAPSTLSHGEARSVVSGAHSPLRRLLFATSLILMTSVTFAALSATPVQAADTQQLLQRAQEALSAERYSVAVELYLRLWAQTQDSGALFNVSIIKYKQEKFRESEEYLDRYIEASGVDRESQRIVKLRSRIKRAQAKRAQERIAQRPPATPSSTEESPQGSLEAPAAHDHVTSTPQRAQSEATTSRGSGLGGLSASRHPPSSDWVTPTLYGVGAASAISAVGLYLYAHQTWDESEGGAYLDRFEARRQAETLTWVGDGLMLSGVAILVYTALRSHDDAPSESAYRLNIQRDALTLHVTF